MKALLQRVKYARVLVEQEVVGEIGPGLLVFLGVDKEDDEKTAEKLLDKVLSYRVFGDDQDKMNLSLKDTQGGLLVVSQFTLSANTQKGLRPSFSSAASPQQGEFLYNHFLKQAHQHQGKVASGQFAANMQVELTNDGPVTFWLEVSS
ncbi:D-tyrosyl-tRNA(Tyr) deacylase [Marinospirillum celere]|uniref:D-aminoacyl-tRNA deacylase n=1 Tax=Marinospirillum celere TaxID=1122252 RepID=A0A1I1IA79_9GAMM|nr:D-aminoacyl-tRNA deacylase [Marinospirillum celere]SFC30723.1 D-tyrosyl-tRNA(Tyr) deacylase [Marinospirillum celere]